MKCNRKVCDNKGEYVHKDNNQLYCRFCAVRINRGAEIHGEPKLFDLKGKQNE